MTQTKTTISSVGSQEESNTTIPEWPGEVVRFLDVVAEVLARIARTKATGG